MASLPLKLAFAEIRKLAGDRKKDLWYWYCPEDAKGQPLLLVAKKKIAPADINAARQGAKSTKSCHGRIGLDEKVLKMTAVGPAPSNLKKSVREIAADNGLRVNEVVLLENQPDEDDTAPMPVADGSEQSSSESSSGGGDDPRSRYERALAKAQPKIDRMRDEPRKSRVLLDIMQDVKDKAERGRYEDAIAALGRIDAMAKVSDKTLDREARKVAAMERVDEEQIRIWAEEQAEWRDAIDLARYEVPTGGPDGKGGLGEIRILKSLDDDAPPLVLKTGQLLDKEAEVYAKVGPHPNIARCLGLQNVGGRNGLVLEAVKGGDMSQALAEMNELRKSGKLSEEQYWGMLQFSTKRTLEALAFMQQQGVVHRDIKPPNVMFDDVTGEPKLVDMGIGGDIGGGSDGATPGYVPAGLGETDEKRDPFAVGASMYEVTQGNTGKVEDGDKRFKYGEGEMGGGWAWILKAGQWAASGKKALEVSDNPDEVFTTDEQGTATKKPGKYGANSSYVDFVNWLMHPDPAQRPTPAEALMHPFLQESLLDDDAARENIKALIAGRKPADEPAIVPDEIAEARDEVVQLLEGGLAKDAAAASKRATQVAKLAEALRARAAKGGQVLGEEVLKFESVLEELKASLYALMDGHGELADAGQQLSAVTNAHPGTRTKKQEAADLKLMQSVSSTSRAALDAIDALKSTILDLQAALGRAGDVAEAPWRASDRTLGAAGWQAMKREAVAHGLKDASTGISPAFEAYEKLLAGYERNKTAKLHAGVLLALDKLRAKIAAYEPMSTFGTVHPGMRSYCRALLRRIDRKKDRLQNDGPGEQ